MMMTETEPGWAALAGLCRRGSDGSDLRKASSRGRSPEKELTKGL